MNAKHSKSPSAAARTAGEQDEPGPSRVAPATDEPEPDIRIAGEAAHEVDAAWLREHLLKAAMHIATSVRSVNVDITYDERMKSLHMQHMGIDETTDVLTFPSLDDARDPIEADIVVCFDEAHWRAGQYDHAVERELLLYMVHGLLHCAGFDDHDEADFARMHAEEDRILEAIGVGRTYWGVDACEAGHDAAHAINDAERDQGIEG